MLQGTTALGRLCLVSKAELIHRTYALTLTLKHCRIYFAITWLPTRNPCSNGVYHYQICFENAKLYDMSNLGQSVPTHNIVRKQPLLFSSHCFRVYEASFFDHCVIKNMTFSIHCYQSCENANRCHDENVTMGVE